MSRRSSALYLPLSLFLFVALVPSACSISFNLTGLAMLNDSSCGGAKAICLQGNASFSDGNLQLTTNHNYSLGRAYYAEPLLLWDKSTGEVTNFSTNFSIAITHVRDFGGPMGDGMAFFLSPYPYNAPPNSDGGYLGLMTKGGPRSSPFIAVEFDTYANSDPGDKWDPPFKHIGIDVNSITSNATKELDPCRYCVGDIKGTATVSYDATTHNLSVLFFNQSGVISVSSVVDLHEVLPDLVVVGFTASNGLNVEFNTVLSWEFESTLKERNKTAANSRSNVTTVGILVGLSAAIGLIVVVLGLVLLLLWRRSNRRIARERGLGLGEGTVHLGIQNSIDEGLENNAGPRQFPYDELAAATNNFSEDNKLGVGGFGDVYKGFLSGADLHVAIKRLSKNSKQGAKEYVSEINIISRLRHKNLVRLIGWCHEHSELLLVYEYMANGSLDTHLFNNDNILAWPMRYNIALGLASALLYLHTEWEQYVVHRDIKSSNIMLDNDFNAKLGDFGLARLVDHGSGMKTTMVAGTLGYLAPECVIARKSSKESDVYSFGVVLLEIACGRRPIEPTTEQEKVQMLDWVWSLYGSDRILEAADQRLKGIFDKTQIERLMIVGLSCANPDINARPSMRQVVAALNFEVVDMIHLPRQMPTLMYSSSRSTAAMTGELQPGTPVSTRASYSTIPNNSGSGITNISTVSSKSVSSSTSLLASMDI